MREAERKHDPVRVNLCGQDGSANRTSQCFDAGRVEGQRMLVDRTSTYGTFSLLALQMGRHGEPKQLNQPANFVGSFQ